MGNQNPEIICGWDGANIYHIRNVFQKMSLDIPEGFDPCPGILADPKFHGRIMLSSKKEL